jgi:hypothetical protein
MKIDRSNYEIWLIDWLDGNLNDFQVNQLMVFLDENPDLKEEFEEFNSLQLKPSGMSLPDKEMLRKSVADLSLSQFEYLSVAFLENDLSDDQKAEIVDIIDKDHTKKESFELIRKTRLTPPDIGYRHKKQLYRRTPAQKIVRLSLIGLSAAAIIALVIMTYLIIPRSLPDNIINTAQNFVSDTLSQETINNIEPDLLVTEKKLVVSGAIEDNNVAEVQKKNSDLPLADMEETVLTTNDSLFRNPDDTEIILKKVPVNTKIDLKSTILSNKLVAYNYSSGIPAYEDERSNFSRFIARTFRDKVLREEVSTDNPLKGYEIAEAGVTGLNRLLGWDMSLVANNDENGELQSVNFNSKILKFNAPVKKSVPLP